MPRSYAQKSFLTRREQRAAYEQEREQDFLAQAQQLASQIQQNQIREAEFEARAKQQELENARYAAKEIMAEQERQHTLKALPLLTQFSANRPGSEAELAQIVAEMPGAFGDPLVKELFSRRQKEVEESKMAVEKYSAVTGGMPVPVSRDGKYDLPRAQARIDQITKLNDARSKGLIKKDEDYAAWMSMDEYQFNNPNSGFASWAAAETERISKLQSADERRNEAVKQDVELGQAAIKASEGLKPDPMVVTDPKAFKTQAEAAQKMAADGANRVKKAITYLDTTQVTTGDTPRRTASDWVKSVAVNPPAQPSNP